MGQLPIRNKKYTNAKRPSNNKETGLIKRQQQGKRTRNLNLGCWNVQGLATKIDAVQEELGRYGMDVVVLSETKKKGFGNEVIGDFLHFWSGVDKSARARAGVSIMVRKELKPKIKGWDFISERIIKLDMVGWGREICIVGVYAPTNDMKDEEKDKFWDGLKEVLEEVPRRKEVFIMGDINARVGRDSKSKIVGRYGEEERNDNGERLIEICDQFDLRIANSFFQHKSIHTKTWSQYTRKLSSVIDYIVVKQSSSCQLLNVRVYRGADCGSDHHLVKAHSWWPWTNITKMEKKSKEEESKDDPTKRIYLNVELLKDPSIRDLYERRLDSELDESFRGCAEEVYEYLTSKIKKVALEVLGETAKSGNNRWLNPRIKEEIDRKREAYEKWLSSKKEGDRRKYIRIKRDLNKKIRAAKKEEWDTTCARINSQLGFSRSREAWKILNELRTNGKNKISEEQLIEMQKWDQYFNELLNEERPQFVDESTVEYGGCSSLQVTQEEVRRVISQGKNAKSPGPGGVNMELLKCGGSKVIILLKELVNSIFQNGVIPEEMSTGEIVPIFKKGDRKKCSSYRGICVTNSIMKVVGRIIKERLESEFTASEEQCGFTAGKSCVDQIFTLRQLLEKQRDKAKATELVFIDLRKAYDSVPRSLLWQALHTAGISEPLIKIIRRIYEGNRCRVRVGSKASRQFATSKGLLQGCCMSPVLFKIYLDISLREWTRKCRKMGIQIGEDLYLFNLLFADDQALIAQDEEDINYMIRKLAEEYSIWGLEINLEKTEYMSATPMSECVIDGQALRKVTSFRYLGAYLQMDGTSDKDIEKRVVSARKAIGMLNSVLWNSNVQLTTKKNIYSAIIQSILLYASETWTVSKKMQNRIVATEMDFWRRSARISRREKKRNSEVRRIVDRENTVLEEIDTRKLVWFGHVRRMGERRLPRGVMEWEPQGRRKRGRPRDNWRKSLDEIMTGRGLSEQDALDRQYWRSEV